MAYSNIDKPNQYFNTILWTGDGSSSRGLTGVNFQPDWTWIKRRSDAQAHSLTDSVRGVTKSLRSDTTAAEDTNNANGYVTSFDSDGFTVAKGSDPSRTNTSGATYVGWNWLAGGTASSNTDGSITSQVSANTTSGFSIVQWTGTQANGTIGHGLGVAPSMIIVKANAVKDWMVGHDGIGWTKYINLNTTGAASTASTVWQDTAPTSSVFSVGSSSDVNTSSTSMIAYCFAEKKGFSKAFSYTGNGNADGSFVFCGFRPAFILVKNTSTAGTNWQIVDNKRVGYNGANHRIYPDDSAAESTTQTMDILSNGFKMRTTSNLVNASGSNYIGIAFAENPLVGSNLVPNNAR